MDYNFDKNFAEICKDKDFWINLEPKIDPCSIPFEPVCYITSRVIPIEWTQEWLCIKGFACLPIVVTHSSEKWKAAIEMKLDYFVDDSFMIFESMDRHGVNAFLMDATHNQRYQVGDKRIYNLSDIIY